jgi:hypothetical protein
MQFLNHLLQLWKRVLLWWAKLRRPDWLRRPHWLRLRRTSPPLLILSSKLSPSGGERMRDQIEAILKRGGPLSAVVFELPADTTVMQLVNGVWLPIREPSDDAVPSRPRTLAP